MNRVKELRLEKGWTKAELSRRSGVNQRTIASLEGRPVQIPNMVIGLALARALGVDPAELIGESPNARRVAICGSIEAPGVAALEGAA